MITVSLAGGLLLLWWVWRPSPSETICNPLNTKTINETLNASDPESIRLSAKEL